MDFKLPEVVVGLDFETYYDKDYSLKKIDTSDYVRDERFLAYGIGIMSTEVPFTTWHTYDEIQDALSQFDWRKTAVCAHNAAFDGLILSHHYGIHPCFFFDTLSMSRGLYGLSVKHDLDALAARLGIKGKVFKEILTDIEGVRDPTEAQLKKLGEYCMGDVEAMCHALDIMLHEITYPEKELQIIDAFMRMFTLPLLEVNEKLASKLKDEEDQQRLEAREKALSILEVERGEGDLKWISTVLNSGPKFASALEYLGAEVPMKTSPTTGKQTFAFSKNDLGFQALQAHDDERIRDLVECRLTNKSNIVSKKAEKLITRTQNGLRLPLLLNYNGAHTMRASGGDGLNPQNFPNLRKSQIRKALIAPKGYVIVVVDSSQIEARLVLWLAGQEDILDQFRRKEDIYLNFASELYGRELDKEKNATERQVGKTAILGLGYGMGPPKFKLTLATGAMGPKIIIDTGFAKHAVDFFRQKNYKVVALWKLAQKMLPFMGTGDTFEFGPIRFAKNRVDMPNGLSLHYEGLRAYDDPDFGVSYEYYTGHQWSKLYGGKFVENIIQCLGRIAVFDQALEIAKEYDIVTTSHDEVVYLAPEEYADEALAYGIECLSTPQWWCPDMPFAAEGVYDHFYNKP